MISKKRGQGAVEFIVVFSMALFFFVVFFTSIQIHTEKKNQEKENLYVQNVALDVRDEINLAAGSSNGYYREFTTPLSILGRDYEINLTNDFIYVKTENSAYSYLTHPINGSIQKGDNVIQKQNGTVYLN